MLIEEYGPEFRHVEGEKNVVADTLSRLDMEFKEGDEIATDEPATQLSYMNPMEATAEEFPMNPTLIKKFQRKDRELQRKLNSDKKERFTNKKSKMSS